MARRKRPDAVTALAQAALEGIGDPSSVDEGADTRADEPEVSEERVRKPRPVDAATAALFPAGVVVVHEMIAAAAKAWREATDREVPSVERLSAPGAVQRVDVDAASGYVAVVTAEDTWRAFLPREQLSTVVALMLRRPIDDVARVMAAGPGSITPTP